MRARRLFSAVAALVAGLLWVVIDPSGPSAMAYQAPPPSLAVPGSVISSGNLSSPDLYNKALTNSPKSLTVGGVVESGSKLGLRGVAGSVGAGLIGFQVHGNQNACTLNEHLSAFQMHKDLVAAIYPHHRP